MTIQFFSDKLRESLTEKIQEFNPEEDDLFRLGKLLTIMRDTIRELKEFTNTYAFEDEAAEITFFKHVKPPFMAEYFYYKKLFGFRLFDSFRDEKARHENYQAELKRLQQHATRNKDFYEYCLTGAEDLDRQYFLRGTQKHDALDRDEKFSTGYDTRLARVRANELIRKHIQRKLIGESKAPVSELTWTESKTALVELIYALHAAKAFNKGEKVDIRPIASTFEACFNISMEHCHRIFQDIRLRKGSSTSFLDHLRKTLQSHIDSLDR